MLRNMLAAKNHRSCLNFNIYKLIIVCTAVTAAAMSFWHDSKLDLNVRYPVLAVSFCVCRATKTCTGTAALVLRSDNTMTN